MIPDPFGTGTKLVRDKPCVYTGPGRSALDRFPYPLSDGFTCESDTAWNWDCLRVVLRPCKPNTIRTNPCQCGSDPTGTELH